MARAKAHRRGCKVQVTPRWGRKGDAGTWLNAKKPGHGTSDGIAASPRKTRTAQLLEAICKVAMFRLREATATFLM
jgi:hypothetical protein